MNLFFNEVDEKDTVRGKDNYLNGDDTMKERRHYECYLLDRAQVHNLFYFN
jgi:hypothetical protein